jgi:hypothetical protein
MGYPELVTWTAKLSTSEKFFDAFDSIVAEGREAGIFPSITFYNSHIALRQSEVARPHCDFALTPCKLRTPLK